MLRQSIFALTIFSVALLHQAQAATPSTNAANGALVHAPKISQKPLQVYCSEPTALALGQTDQRWSVKVDPKTRWQPRTGIVTLTVTRGTGNQDEFVPAEACFGWLRPDGSVALFDRNAPIRILKSDEPSTVQLEVTVP